jgi:RNA polymerase sigma factor (sigma-70 family)
LRVVKAVPGTVQSGGATFATTHWSVIAACTPGTEAETDKADAALAQLCHDYWPPLYNFVRRRGFGSADAQDLVQGFFGYFLERKAYAHAAPNKGKFRSFLLASLKNYMADVWDREHAMKRGGKHEFVLLDAELHVVESHYGNNPQGALLDEEQEYERQWAAALVSSAINRLEAQFREGAKARLFAELKCFITGGTGLPKQEDVAEKLGIPIDTLRSHLSRLRVRYRELLREEVARTIAQTDDVDEELRHLRKILTADC